MNVYGKIFVSISKGSIILTRQEKRESIVAENRRRTLKPTIFTTIIWLSYMLFWQYISTHTELFSFGTVEMYYYGTYLSTVLLIYCAYLSYRSLSLANLWYKNDIILEKNEKRLKEGNTDITSI